MAIESARRLQLCTLWQICWPIMSQSVLASTMLTSCCAWEYTAAGVNNHSVYHCTLRSLQDTGERQQSLLTPSCCTMGTKRSAMKPCACNTCNRKVHFSPGNCNGVRVFGSVLPWVRSISPTGRQRSHPQVFRLHACRCKMLRWRDDVQKVECVPCKKKSFAVSSNATRHALRSSSLSGSRAQPHCSELAWPVELVDGPTQCIFGVLHMPLTRVGCDALKAASPRGLRAAGSQKRLVPHRQAPH